MSGEGLEVIQYFIQGLLAAAVGIAAVAVVDNIITKNNIKKKIEEKVDEENRQKERSDKENLDKENEELRKLIAGQIKKKQANSVSVSAFFWTEGKIEEKEIVIKADKIEDSIVEGTLIRFISEEEERALIEDMDEVWDTEENDNIFLEDMGELIDLSMV